MPGNKVKITASDGFVAHIDASRFSEHYDEFVRDNKGATVTMYNSDGKSEDIALGDALSKFRSGYSYSAPKKKTSPKAVKTDSKTAVKQPESSSEVTTAQKAQDAVKGRFGTQKDSIGVDAQSMLDNAPVQPNATTPQMPTGLSPEKRAQYMAELDQIVGNTQAGIDYTTQVNQRALDNATKMKTYGGTLAEMSANKNAMLDDSRANAMAEKLVTDAVDKTVDAPKGPQGKRDFQSEVDKEIEELRRTRIFNGEKVSGSKYSDAMRYLMNKRNGGISGTPGSIVDRLNNADWEEIFGKAILNEDGTAYNASVLNGASRSGMTPEAYIDRFLSGKFQSALEKKYNEQISRSEVKNVLDYFLKKAESGFNSGARLVLGKDISTDATLNAEALAKYDEGLSWYNPQYMLGVAAEMATNPITYVAGGAGGATLKGVKALAGTTVGKTVVGAAGKALTKFGATGAGKVLTAVAPRAAKVFEPIVAKVSPEKALLYENYIMSNLSSPQWYGKEFAKLSASGMGNLSTFMGLSSVSTAYQIGADTSGTELLKTYLLGVKNPETGEREGGGALTGAMVGFGTAITAPFAKYLKGMASGTAQKIGASAAGIALEGLQFTNMNMLDAALHGRNIKLSGDGSDGSLVFTDDLGKSMGMVIGLKFQHPTQLAADIRNIVKGGPSTIKAFKFNADDKEWLKKTFGDDPSMLWLMNDAEYARINKALESGDGATLDGVEKNIYNLMTDKEGTPWTVRNKLGGQIMGLVNPARPLYGKHELKGDMLYVRGADGELIYTKKVKNADEAKDVITSEEMFSNWSKTNDALAQVAIKYGDDEQLQSEVDTIMTDISTKYVLTGEELMELSGKDPMKMRPEEYAAYTELGNKLRDLFLSKNEGKEATEAFTEAGRAEADDMNIVDNPNPSGVVIIEKEVSDAMKKAQELLLDKLDIVGTGFTAEDVNEWLNGGMITADDAIVLFNALNAEARLNGFIGRTGEKINEKAEIDFYTQRLKGKVDGSDAEDVRVTVQDKNGNTFYLISGDVSGDKIISESGSTIVVDAEDNIQYKSPKELTLVGVESKEDAINPVIQQKQEEVTANNFGGGEPKVEPSANTEGTVAPEVKTETPVAEEKPVETTEVAKKEQLTGEVKSGYDFERNGSIDENRTVKSLSKDIEFIDGEIKRYEESGNTVLADFARGQKIGLEELLQKKLAEPKKKKPNSPEMNKFGEMVDSTRKGHKQITKAVEKAQEILFGTDVSNLDDKSMLELLNVVNSFYSNVARGAESTPLEKSFFDEIQVKAKENGYEIVDLLDKPYNEGMKVIAEFSEDDFIPEGSQIISSVRKPMVLKDGVMVQAAEIHVKQNTPREVPDGIDNAEAFATNKQKYESTRVEGRKTFVRTADGKKFPAVFVLGDARSLVTSHDPHTFEQTNGAPVRKDGKSMNDNDYQNNANAQQNVRVMANDFTGKALQNMPYVDKNGITLSGNNRTMSRVLAGEKGTDSDYMEELYDTLEQYGFTREQVDAKLANGEIPEIHKEIVGELPYTTETYAMFNKSDMKKRNPVEESIAQSKVLRENEGLTSQLTGLVDKVENLGDLYGDEELSKQLIQFLVNGGVITKEESAEWLNDDGVLSDIGKKKFETIMNGVVLDEDGIRLLNNPDYKLGNIRKNIAYSIVELMKNQRLGDYSLIKDFNKGLELYGRAKGAGNETIGDLILWATQEDMFTHKAPIDDYTYDELFSAITATLKQKAFKAFFKDYNARAKEASAGQTDMFNEGEVLSKEQIVESLLNALGHDTAKLRERINRTAQAEPRVPVADENASGRQEGNGETDGEVGTPEIPQETPEERFEKNIVSAMEYLEKSKANDPVLGLMRKFGYTREYADKLWRDILDRYQKEKDAETKPEADTSETVTTEEPKSAEEDIRKTNPLTEEQILADDTLSDNAKDAAIDFLKGEEEPGGFGEISYRRIANKLSESAEKPVAEEKAEEKPEPKPEVKTSGTVADAEETAPKEAKTEENPQEKTREEQKAEDLANIKAADDKLKNFLSTFGEEFRKAGRGELSVSLIGLNSKQVEMIGTLVEYAADSAYARIKSGVHDIEAIIKELVNQFGPMMKQAGLDDDNIKELLDTRLRDFKARDPETKERKKLTDWIESYKASANTEETEADTKETPKEVSFKLSSEMNESERPKTKDGWIRAMLPIYTKMCEKVGLPVDNLLHDVHDRLYPRITKGYTLDKFPAYYDGYVKMYNDLVSEPATEKQMAYIKKIGHIEGSNNDLWSIVEGAKLSKRAASYVIDLINATEDIYNIDEHRLFEKELKKVAELNGKKFDVEPKVKSPEEAKKDQRVNQESIKYSELDSKKRSLKDTITSRLKKSIVNENERIKSINELRNLAKEHGIEDILDTDLQEIVESSLVDIAREFASNKDISEKDRFDSIRRLYEMQPSLNQRDTDRVMLQQYSTPAPMAYLLGMFVDPEGKAKSGLEPSAGNGMLTIRLDKGIMDVNDIDITRLSNLRTQGFNRVTNQDGLLPFGDKKYDVVVTNPPFGGNEAKDYDGYKISGLGQQMAINALDSMKDDGRAAIILGGNTEYQSNGALKGGDRQFYEYLYSHYNVADIINLDGKKLYSRQGTGYDVKMILINGRKNFDINTPWRERDHAPIKSEARAEQIHDYDELFNRINDDVLHNEYTIPSDTKEVGDGNKANVSGNVSGNGLSGITGGTTKPSVEDSARPSGGSGRANNDTRTNEQPTTGHAESNGYGRGNTDLFGGRESAVEPESKQEGNTDGGRGNGVPAGGVRGNATSQSVSDGKSSDSGVRQNTDKPAVKQTLGTEKVPYRAKSKSYSFNSVVPAKQAAALEKVLDKLGDVDQLIVDELGYASKEELYSGNPGGESILGAEQVDGVALGITQLKKGKGLIIGDQTGIGKGRQAASFVRYAIRNGQIPIFVTYSPDLFNTFAGDLADTHNGHFRPLLIGDPKSGSYIHPVTGEPVKVPSAAKQKANLEYIAKTGKLPNGYDFIMTTYSQFNSGTTQWTKVGWRERPKKGAIHISGQRRRDAIESILDKGGLLIFDECHNAAGQGDGSKYWQKVTPKSKGTIFLSATFAKDPEAMALYALKTDLGGADSKDTGKLLNAIKKGGAVFQEIMSQTLTASGQLIRRERDMTGVTVDWKPITEDEAEIKSLRQRFDNMTDIFNSIIAFQRKYVDPVIDAMNDAAALIQGNVDHVPGKRDMGIRNVSFTSELFQTVQASLFALKASYAGKEAVEQLKNGLRPIIAVNNTLEGVCNDYSVGDTFDNIPDLGSKLLKGLNGTLKIMRKEGGLSWQEMLPLDHLSREGQDEYHRLVKLIDEANTGLSVSPIDNIIYELEDAGYKIGELTGRSTNFTRTEDGSYQRVNRKDTDKKALANRFNNEDLNALILNRSASTGINLHASSKFKNQEPRPMIFAQMQTDINQEIQIRGRNDRTGQIHRGSYIYVVSPIPAEQRLMMMFKTKLKSLDANTTASQKSKFNEVDVPDMTNKYGNDIAIQYLSERPDLYSRLSDPLNWEYNGVDIESASIDELRSNMKKGQGDAPEPMYSLLKRLALLKCDEQEEVLNDLAQLYNTKIAELDEAGQNDLEIKDMPLSAKTLSKEVWKEGEAPGTENAFLDNTYVEHCEVNVLKKPMKASEITKVQKRMFEGKNPDEWQSEKREEIDAIRREKRESVYNKRTESAKEKAEQEANKIRNSIKKQNEKLRKKIEGGETLSPNEVIVSEVEMERQAREKYDEIIKEEHRKRASAIEKVELKYGSFLNVLKNFNTRDVYTVPYDFTDEEYDAKITPAKLLGFKFDKNLTAGSSYAVFATLDGRRKVEVSLRDDYRISKIIDYSYGYKERLNEINLDNWDTHVPDNTRKEVDIITGNIMQALADSEHIGSLVSYTTDTGEIRQGVLVRDNVDIKTVMRQAPISQAIETLLSKDNIGKWVVSSDWKVRIKSLPSMGEYEIRVPKSRKEGGKFYLDRDLSSLMKYGQFVTNGNDMTAVFPKANLKAVISRLENEHSVKAKIFEYQDGDSEKPIFVDNKDLYDIKSVHFREGDEEKPAKVEATKVVVEHARKVADEYNKVGSGIDIVTSEEELDARGKAILSNDPTAKGAYDNKTKKVYIFAQNNHCRADVEQTIFHEKVGHDGLRGLLGEQGYRKFMGKLWYGADKEMRSWVTERMSRNGMELYNAIDEYICKKAEDMATPGTFWGKVRKLMNEALRKIGFKGTITQENIREALWLSKNRLRKGNLEDEIRYKDFMRKMKLNPVREEVSKDGNFYTDGKTEKQETDDDLSDVSYSTGETLTPVGMSARNLYHADLNHWWYIQREAHQDNMLAARMAMKAILKASRGELKDNEDFLNAENQLSSRNGDEQKMLVHQIMKPFDKVLEVVIPKMEGNNAKERYDALEKYVYSLSGLERNRIFAVRKTAEKYNTKLSNTILSLEAEQKKAEEKYNLSGLQVDKDVLDDITTKLQKAKGALDALNDMVDNFDIERDRLNTELKNGNITLRDYFNQMDWYIRKGLPKYDAGKNDMSGLRATDMYGDGEQYDDAQLIEDVMDIEAQIGKDGVNALWSSLKAITDFSLDKEYNSQCSSKAAHDNAKSEFNWYAPLRGFNEDSAEDTWGYMNSEVHMSGKVLMTANGRSSMADHPIATAIAMANRSIIRGNRNLMLNYFRRFVQNHQSDLITELGETWYEKDASTGEWVAKYPEITPEMDGNAVAKEIADFNLRMEEAQNNGQDVLKQSQLRANIPLKFEKKSDKNQHFINVLVGGKTHTFVVNGNPRLAQALNGMLNDSWGDNAKFQNVLKKPTNFISKMATSYSITFMARNAVRDWEAASSYLLATEGPKYAGLFEKNYFLTIGARNLANVGLGGLLPGASAESLVDKLDTMGDKYKPLKKGVEKYLEVKDHKLANSMMMLFSKYKRGTLNENNLIEKRFKEFMENGGETGFVQLKDIDKYQQEIEDFAKKISRSKLNEYTLHDPAGIGKIFGVYGNIISSVNEGVENHARFATYLTSREMGRSIVRSIADAKNASANFNRHGSGFAALSFRNGKDKIVNTHIPFIGEVNISALNRFTAGNASTYMRTFVPFYNATMQGLRNFGYMAAKNPIITSGLGLALGGIAFGIPTLNAIIASNADTDDERKKWGDNPYVQLPEYERRQNFCLYMGHGRWIKIPLAPEIRPFYGLGDLVAGWTTEPRLQSTTITAPEDGVKKYGSMVMDAVTEISQITPIDLGGSKAIWNDWRGKMLGSVMPGSLAPIVAVSFNMNWMGTPIWHENMSNENAPAWTKANYRTPKWLVDASRTFSEKTRRGNDVEGFGGQYNNPSAIFYLMQQYMGGPNKDITEVFTAINEGSVDMGYFPVTKAFTRSKTPENTANNARTRFYAYGKEADETKANIKQLKEEMNSGNFNSRAKLNAMKDEHGPAINRMPYLRMKLYERYEKKIKKGYIRKNKAQSPVDKAIIQQDINNNWIEFCNIVDQMEKDRKNGTLKKKY